MSEKYLQPFLFSKILNFSLITISESLGLSLQKMVVLFQMGLMVFRWSSLNQPSQSIRSRIQDLGVGVQHFNDPIDQCEDSEPQSPVLLIQQLKAYFPPRKYMKMLKPVQTPNLRRIVGVVFANHHSQFIATTLQVRILLSFEDEDPFSIILQIFRSIQQNCPNRRLYFFFIFLLQCIQSLVILIHQSQPSQILRHYLKKLSINPHAQINCQFLI